MEVKFDITLLRKASAGLYDVRLFMSTLLDEIGMSTMLDEINEKDGFEFDGEHYTTEQIEELYSYIEKLDKFINFT